MELDPEALPELDLVLLLELALRRRKRGTKRVVDQVETQVRARATVAQAVQPAQCLDAAVEHLSPALALDVLPGVAGQRSDHRHVVLGEELRQIPISALVEDGEIAAVDHLESQRPCPLHQDPEIRVHLRSAAREVERPHAGTRREEIEHPSDHGLVHGLGALGPGLHVTVVAGEVAAQRHVQLQSVDPRASEWLQSMAPEHRVEVCLLHSLSRGPRGLYSKRFSVPGARQACPAADR